MLLCSDEVVDKIETELNHFNLIINNFQTKMENPIKIVKKNKENLNFMTGKTMKKTFSTLNFHASAFEY